MSCELLSNGNLPLTVILKSLPVLCVFLSEKEEDFMKKLGTYNKKLYSKMRVLVSGRWKKDLKDFQEVYNYLEQNYFTPIEDKVVNTRRNMDDDIRIWINTIFTNYKNKEKSRDNLEILVNLLIPKEKWIELNSANLLKMLNFYHKIRPNNLTEIFENFLFKNNKISLNLSDKLSQYYFNQRIFNQKFSRSQVYKAVKFKKVYEELFKDI